MGVLGWVVYRPYEDEVRRGISAELLSLIRMHRGVTFTKGLTTRFNSVYFRTPSGCLVEVLEWESRQGMQRAKEDEMIGGDLWREFESVCDMLTLASVVEMHERLPCFERIDVITRTGLSSIEEGRYQVAVYEIAPNKEEEFVRRVVEQRHALTSTGLVSELEPIYMRSSNGSVVQIFEWISADARKEAGGDDEKSPLWSRFDGVASLVPLASLPESQQTYPTFAPFALQPRAAVDAPDQPAISSE